MIEAIFNTCDSFEHGGNIYRLAEELKMQERKIMDFSASVNPLGVSKKIKTEMRRHLKYLHNYPDHEAKRLRKRLAQYHGIDPETILCGNGSTELIYLITRVLKPQKVLIPAPTFSEYERAIILQNTAPLTHPSPSRGEGEGGGEDSEPRTTSPELINLIPAMKIKTKILCIRSFPSGSPISYGRTFITKRPSRIGVLPLGYADGYSRFFSNNAEVLVKGKRVPVVGRICMDLTMIDITDVKDVRGNDEVIILGKQGKESITAQELAYKANTISYEILTSLGNKSKRIYVETH